MRLELQAHNVRRNYRRRSTSLETPGGCGATANGELLGSYRVARKQWTGHGGLLSLNELMPFQLQPRCMR